ncbi:hypothetical protein VA596_15560 [Amycolatopsis sp., V23-08]|uniref:Uncharacterized protein n=1 Tax=Amycolatopsis heterodermiae TaxID=3110235 RepID=A0ABU5R539_9PSEU|nr:hypothetical protein [Amycolatopsis sp., V23-08]MEA5360965.1 hypothetical protein [Amycolatopsis sp., V23-08]
MDVFTGARWGELVGRQRHEYDSERRRVEIRTPLKEVGGKVRKKTGRVMIITRMAAADQARKEPTQEGADETAAGTRFVALPPGIAVLYEKLMDSHRDAFALSTPDGGRIPNLVL